MRIAESCIELLAGHFEPVGDPLDQQRGELVGESLGQFVEQLLVDQARPVALPRLRALLGFGAAVAVLGDVRRSAHDQMLGGDDWLPSNRPRKRESGVHADCFSVGSVGGTCVELCSELEAGAAVEDRVVSYERDTPTDRCCRDPQVSVVASLVQTVPNLPTFVSQSGDGLDRVDINRQDTCTCDQAREAFNSGGAPAGAERTIASLGDRLGSDRDALPEYVLRIACGKR